MAKVKQPTYKTGIKIIVVCLFIFLLTFTILLYLKLNRLNAFLKGIYQVRIIRSYSGDKVQKLVYYSDKKSMPKTLLTNEALDPQGAIELPLWFPEEDFKEQEIPFYKKNYFVIKYGGVEGGSDYLIFDQDGKVITKALIANTDKSQLPIQNVFSSSIIGLIREDGILTLQISEGKSPIKQYYARFDITTGKLKSVSSQ